MASLTSANTILRSLGIAIAFVLFIGAAPETADAQSKLAQAKAEYQKGNQFFSSGDYRAAAKHFAAADALVPSPVLEYNIGLCHERLGETAEALRRFRSYRVRAPNAANRAEVDAKIARLEAAERPTVNPTPPDPTPDPNANTTDPDPNTVRPDPDPNATRPDPTINPDPNPNANTTTPKTYGPTGDPALDRVAAVDLNQIAARHPSVAAPAAPPPPNSGAGDDDEFRQTGAAGPVKDKGEKKPKPLYKRWWFWVVVGVSALILIDIASNDSGSNSRVLDNAILDPSLNGSSQPGGFTIRF